MNYGSAELIAKTLLYEGYLLYPHRTNGTTSGKRWRFGSLYPKAYAERGRERSHVTAEALVRGAAPLIGVRAVFLVACERWLGDARRVEVVERRIDFEPSPAVEAAQSRRFEARSESWCDGPARFSTRPLEGVLEVATQAITPSTTKVRVRFENVTHVSAALSNEDAELVAFGAAHLMLAVESGSFVSPVEPPPELAEAAHGCKNDGVWPAIVGDPARQNRMLASPIVVHDAPAGTQRNLGARFDVSEIDVLDELERAP